VRYRALLGASVKERPKYKLFYVHLDVRKVQFAVNGCHCVRLGDWCAMVCIVQSAAWWESDGEW
jgi:hypothetical protein